MYTVDSVGNIVRADGMAIAKDVSSIAYQQYLYWQQHGVYVGPMPDALPEAPPAKVQELEDK